MIQCVCSVEVNDQPVWDGWVSGLQEAACGHHQIFSSFKVEPWGFLPPGLDEVNLVTQDSFQSPW